MTVPVNRSSKPSSMNQHGLDDATRLSKLRDYVYKAIVSKSTPGSSHLTYNRLVQELSALRQQSDNESSQASFASLLGALAGCVSVIKEHDHQDLLNNIIGVRLWSCTEMVRDAVLDLMVNLGIFNVNFVHPSLEMMVLSFTEPPGPPAPDSAPGEPWQPPANAISVQASIVAALGKVLQEVPTASSRLLSIVVRNRPSKMRARSTQCLYLSAMYRLAMTPAAAAIRDGLLMAAVEHLLDLDVEIRWEDIVEAPADLEEDEEEAQEDAIEEDLFAMNDLDLNAEVADPLAAAGAGPRGGWEGAAAMQQPAASTSGRPPVDETADKLDSLMDITFQHLLHRCEAGDSAAVWEAVMRVFESNVLSTHRSKFTQFLIFYLGMREPHTACRKFVDVLLARLADPSQASTTRSACAAYLASFLARAAFAPESAVVHALVRLTAIAQQLAAAASASLSTRADRPPAISAAEFLAPDSSGLPVQQRHQVFYATCQAILYLLCYHMQPLLAGPGVLGRSPPGPQRAAHAAAVRQLVQHQLPPLLLHPLAPLRLCLPSVSSEFVYQASALDLIPASTLRPLLPSSGSRAGRPLEMFFPFDPYLLHRSSKWLDLPRSYVRWRHGHPRGGEAGEMEAGEVEGDSVDGISEDASEDSTSTSQDSSVDSDDEVGVDGSEPAGGSPVASLDLAASPVKLGLLRRASTGRLRPTPVGFMAGTTPSDHHPSSSFPPADMMYGVSYGSSPPMRHSLGSTPPTLGASPVAMSITPVGMTYMQSIPQRLARHTLQ